MRKGRFPPFGFVLMELELLASVLMLFLNFSCTFRNDCRTKSARAFVADRSGKVYDKSRSVYILPFLPVPGK